MFFQEIPRLSDAELRNFLRSESNIFWKTIKNRGRKFFYLVNYHKNELVGAECAVIQSR